MFDIEQELKKLPHSPGVYIHHDSLGEIIYVGKAVDLHNRVRSYFRLTNSVDPKLAALHEKIAWFEYIKCGGELEALILECNLIKKYKPKYNILLKDDKTYPYLKVTTNEEFPRVYITRQIKPDGSRYFGPYTDLAKLHKLKELIDELYPLRKCRGLKPPKNKRACLNYHLGKCLAPCQGEITQEEYRQKINELLDILSLRDLSLINRLKQEMREASDSLNYERAARLRDYIDAIKTLGEQQRVLMQTVRDADILVPLMTEENSIVVRYAVRLGKLQERTVHYIESKFRDIDQNLLEEFIKQFYHDEAVLPHEIWLKVELSESANLERLLDAYNKQNQERGSDQAHKTRLLRPLRGAKAHLLGLALNDSNNLRLSLDERAATNKERDTYLAERLAQIIDRAVKIAGFKNNKGAKELESYLIESYDISNYNGLDTVGAMVSFRGTQALRNKYRKFKVKTSEGDDYGSLQEVIYRRFRPGGDVASSLEAPDLIMLDGGLGQVHAVNKIIDALGLKVPVVGLAKDDSHRTRAIVFADGTEINLIEDHILFSYCGRIQEEVHRFAITYMSSSRSHRIIRSGLEQIPEVGPRRREKLLQHFGSPDAIKRATLDELLAAPGITRPAAESIYNFFHKT